MTLAVEGMTCAGCVHGAERALFALPGMRSSIVTFATATAMVTNAATVDDLVAAAETRGQSARALSGDAAPVDQVATKADKARGLKGGSALAGLLAFPVCGVGPETAPHLRLWTPKPVHRTAASRMPASLHKGPVE